MARCFIHANNALITRVIPITRPQQGLVFRHGFVEFGVKSLHTLLENDLRASPGVKRSRQFPALAVNISPLVLQNLKHGLAIMGIALRHRELRPQRLQFCLECPRVLLCRGLRDLRAGTLPILDGHMRKHLSDASSGNCTGLLLGLPSTAL